MCELKIDTYPTNMNIEYLIVEYDSKLQKVWNEKDIPDLRFWLFLFKITTPHCCTVQLCEHLSHVNKCYSGVFVSSQDAKTRFALEL
jgi:hypothetical protein